MWALQLEADTYSASPNLSAHQWAVQKRLLPWLLYFTTTTMMKDSALPICPQGQQKVPQLSLNPYQVSDLTLISIDNTQGFEDKALNELYVPEGEQAALATKKAIEICKLYGITILEVFDEHPEGHILFAGSYKNKQPYDMITYQEVSQRTPECNGIGENSQFTLEELQTFLQNAPGQKETLRPYHNRRGTQWPQPMQPLQVSDFDRRIPKGASPISAGYSGFEDTCLQEELESERKKILFLAGVATDYCVGQTALDAVDRGYKTYLISEAVRGVRLESTQAKLTELLERGVKIITINQLSDLLSKNFTC